MTKPIPPEEMNNFGLPDEFTVVHEYIFNAYEFEDSLCLGDLSNREDFQKFKTVDYTNYTDKKRRMPWVDCRQEAKVFIGLPKKPYGYFLSLVVFWVIHENDFNRWNDSYRDFLDDDLIRFKDENTRCIDTTLWRHQITEAISNYFDDKRYRKPVPILIKYGRCGCFLDDSGIEFREDKKGKLYYPKFDKKKGDYEYEQLPGYQHSPYSDDSYHQVWMKSPLRFSDALPMRGFLMPIVKQVNHYFQGMVLDLNELHSIWDLLTEVKFRLNNDTLDNDFITKEINVAISSCERLSEDFKFQKTPRFIVDFYRRHYVDLVRDLASQGFGNQCKGCYGLFVPDNPRREYCPDSGCKRRRNNKIGNKKRSDRRRPDPSILSLY